LPVKTEGEGTEKRGEATRKWKERKKGRKGVENPLSYDGCLEVRGQIIRTVLCCIVY